MPSSRARSMKGRLSSSSITQSFQLGEPNVIVPRHKRETFKPDLPRWTYSMLPPMLLLLGASGVCHDYSQTKSHSSRWPVAGGGKGDRMRASMKIHGTTILALRDAQARCAVIAADGQATMNTMVIKSKP